MAKKSIDQKSGTRVVKSAPRADRRRERKAQKVKENSSFEDQMKRLGPYPRSAPEGTELHRLRLNWHTDAARIRDSHRRRNHLRAVDIQEHNFPTDVIAVDLPEGEKRVRKNLTRVRQAEAWRHNQLSAMQRTAETEMQLAWQVRTAGLGPAAMRYDGKSGPAHAPKADDAIGIEQDWLEWFRGALERKIAIAVVLDVLTEPRTLAEIEKARKLKRGAALPIYQRGLDLWCELRGWTRRERTMASLVP